MNSQPDDSPQRAQAFSPQDKFVDVRWTARKLRPAILIYVLLIFATFMAASLVVFQSTNAFKALALAAIASIVALLPQVLSKIEYQANESGLRARPYEKANKEEFKQIFLWKELDHAKFVNQGLRYIKNFDENSPVQRFVKMQFSDKYSGEVRVEAEDQYRVNELLTERGVTIRHH